MPTLPRVLLAAALLLILPQCATGPDSPAPAGMLCHDVFFQLADPSDAEIAALIRGCEGLAAIPSVVDLAAGARRAELVREVNQTDFHVGLHVLFEDRGGLEAYLIHPIHLEFLEEFADGWESVRVFDYGTGVPANGDRRTGSS